MTSFIFKKFFIILIIFLVLTSITTYSQTKLEVLQIEYPEEVLIEKGWTKYISISINNTEFERDLYNVRLFIEGSFSDWFEFQKDEVNLIPKNKAETFIAKISIPYETEVGSYQFFLNIKSDEVSYKKEIVVRVFETRDDVFLYQIQVLRNKVVKLESDAYTIEKLGKDASTVRILIDGIKSSLDLAEQQLHDKMYNDVTETILDVQDQMKKVDFELLTAPVYEVEEENWWESREFLLISTGSLIIVLLLALVYLVRKVKLKSRVSLPTLKIKELVIENKRLKELNIEIQKTRESENIIEEEYKQGLISKESYEELKLKYEEKILQLEEEIKKVRGY